MRPVAIVISNFMFSIGPPTRGFWAFLVAALMAAISVIAEEPVPANGPPRFAAKVIKEGDRYLIEVPARPGEIYCLEVPDGAGGMTFATVPGSAVYAQSDTVRWPLELSGAVVGAEEDLNSPGAAGGASPSAAGGTVLLPLTIEVSESPGTHVRLRVDGANPWVAVAAVAFPRVTYEGFADLPTATGVRCAALSTRVVTAPIGATEPGKAALTLEQQQEFDAIVAGLPQLIAAATLPSGLPPALGNGSPSPLSSSRYFRVAMYRVDTNGNGYLDADELASGMNPFARPGESGYVDASNAGGSNGGNGGGIAPIWDSDDDFSPDFEEIAAGTSPMFKYSAPVVLTSQALYRSAVFDSWGSWTETQVWYSGWRPDVGYWLDAIFSHPDPVPPLGTTPRAGSAFMSDFASGWNAFGLPDPMAGKGLPPQKMFEESSKGSWASFARNVDLLNGPLSGTAGNIRAFGYRYRLRGPSSSVPQMRQFLELTWTKTSGFVPNVGEEAAAAALMEEAPVSVEPVTLTIPPGELYSEPHDMVSQGPADPEMPHSQVGQYLKVVRLLPVEVVSRDKFLAGSIEIPSGWESLAMEFVGPGDENLGKYGSLLGGGVTKIYDQVTDIMSEADFAAGGQSASQKVWFVKDPGNSRKINYYTCFNAVGAVEIKLYLNGSSTAFGSINHTLTEAEDFASTISYVDAWVKGGPFNLAGGGGPVLALRANRSGVPAAPSSAGEGIDSLTRACLIPFFNVINQVEGMAVVARGLFDGLISGLEDDWMMVLLIKQGAVFAGNWAWQQIDVELQNWRDNPLKRAFELKQMADRICEDLVFRSLEQTRPDLSTWEGFRARAWQAWKWTPLGTLVNHAQQGWALTRNNWPAIVDGLTSWADDFSSRMMQGAEKAHWDGAPWAKGKLLADLDSATREFSYTFGYTYGYLCEQVGIGLVTGGVATMAQVAVKGGVSLAASLAKRTTAAVVARGQWLKHLLAEAGAGDALLRAAYERGFAKCAVEPVGPTIKEVIFEVIEKAFSKEGFNRSIYSWRHLQDDILQRPNLSKLVKQQGGEVVFQRRLSQLATILGDEFDAMAAKNFAKVADEFILVKLPDGTVDDFFEGFFRAMEGNPSLLKHADDLSVKMGGALEKLSPNAKARLKQILSDPDPGNPWKLDTPEEWNLDDIPIPSNFYARGLLLELQQFKKVYKPKGFQHHPTAAGYDYSGSLSGFDLLVQMKSLRNPEGAFSAMKKQSISSQRRSLQMHLPPRRFNCTS